ncbi:MAG: DUF1178 family protein [Syntrophales bacterium]|nr:DUF1178 family protein [Syntrophales bacterium]
MIIYDLSCEKGHKFEGWFQSRVAFEDQKEKKLILCPVCGSSEVQVLPSALRVISGDRGRDGRQDTVEITPLGFLKMIQDYVVENFEDVGERFAEVALKIHRGEEVRRNIRGTTTPEEEELLREEEVPFLKIPIIKFHS